MYNFSSNNFGFFYLKEYKFFKMKQVPLGFQVFSFIFISLAKWHNTVFFWVCFVHAALPNFFFLMWPVCPGSIIKYRYRIVTGALSGINKVVFAMQYTVLWLPGRYPLHVSYTTLLKYIIEHTRSHIPWLRTAAFKDTKSSLFQNLHAFSRAATAYIKFKLRHFMLDRDALHVSFIFPYMAF